MFGIDDAALALLAAGAISTAGQLYTNRQNTKFQSKVNDVNWQIAQMNNATQIEMANSAHQREVKDLLAAGLNPILSAGGSGSAVPSLQQARLDSAQVQNPLSGLAESASQISRYFGQTYKAELDGRKAEVANLNQDLNNKELQQEILDNTSAITDMQRDTAQYTNFLQRLQAKMEVSALADLGFKSRKDGTLVPDKKSEYFQRFKSGLLSDQVIKSRQSARNLYQDVLSGISSAKDVVDTALNFTPAGLKRHFLINTRKSSK